MKSKLSKFALVVTFGLTMFSTVFADENFTPSQRWGTWGLNLIPVLGLGSIIIMDDWAGAVPQWVLGGGAITLSIIRDFNQEEECATYTNIKNPNIKSEKCYTHFTETGVKIGRTGAIMYLLSFVYSTYRSITYDKPEKVAYSKYGDFNVAFLPNRNGNFNTHLMYNKAF